MGRQRRRSRSLDSAGRVLNQRVVASVAFREDWACARRSRPVPLALCNNGMDWHSRPRNRVMYLIQTPRKRRRPMRIILSGWVILVLIGLLAAPASAQEEAWKTQMQAADEALKKNDTDSAWGAFQAALQEAERFGPEDPRLAGTLDLVGAFFGLQGQVTQADSLLKRSLTIWERN